MKILAIRGKNLASLEGEFEVDFRVEPLRSAGIFAITGSTGSGKSTLLDAICLALFNDTPRINRASDNADVIDVKNTTIKQKDSRSILRRGAVDGYAEVDFLSLAGDSYRAHWSVRRSRNKIDGSLQSANYKVFNLSLDEELQGGKTELLAKVRELIGLTFDQFTRSVLLAQGDFSTFLKAAPKEKAELLEKLTGTDIYSRISSQIYERTKQAETELFFITDRIKDVELLSDEQMQLLFIEQESISKDFRSLEVEHEVLLEKLNWLRTNVLYFTSVATAQKEFETTQLAIKEASPRFNYWTRLESVQEIRDRFKQLEDDRKQLQTSETAHKEQCSLSVVNQELQTKATETLNTCRTVQKQFAERWFELEPQVKEARRLDVQLEELTKNFAELERESVQVVALKTQSEKTIPILERQIDITQKSQTQIVQWFAGNRIYTDIIDRIDLLVSYISDAFSVAQQVAANEKLLTASQDLFQKESEQLVVQQAESTRLNDILPAEIAALRATLVEGRECPVCGSTHHLITSIDVESLEQQVLTQAKAVVFAEIERLSQSISNRKGEIIRLQSLIVGYREQHDTTFSKLVEAMTSVPDWTIGYHNGTLINTLTDVAQQWRKNLVAQTSHNEQLNLQTQQLQTARERLSELTEQHQVKHNKCALLVSELQCLRTKRNELLGGRKADEIEQLRSQKIIEIEAQIKKATSNELELIVKGEKLAGTICQITDHILQLKSRIELSSKIVFEWLSSRQDQLTIEELYELLSKESSWLNQEREALNYLRKNELAAHATLVERKRVIDEHQKAEVKSLEQDTAESLTVLIDEKVKQLDLKRQRNIQIQLLLVNNEKGKKRIQLFEKELTEKGAVTENWQKLNELFGSADGAKFKVLAQGYTLDVLLGYANRHLNTLTKRYLLERVSPDSLSLQVVDLDMLSEVRSVHSLSGGESFLISLSLALGLSSLSSNRMRVESLFIDEGFGTLDADTLRVAMDALERLQTQGRKIGVISHVVEMTERIPIQIRVIKSFNGRSRVEVVGTRI